MLQKLYYGSLRSTVQF